MFVFFCMKSELLILHLLLTFIYKRMKNLFVFTKKIRSATQNKRAMKAVNRTASKN